jgi:hypothetical protein
MLMKRAALSATVLGLSALMMATGMPTTHDRMTESRAISAVSGPRRKSMSATLSERKKDWPKLPWAIAFTQVRYCTQSGSLRPSSRM